MESYAEMEAAERKAPRFWKVFKTQEQEDQFRSLVAEGKSIDEVMTVIKISRQSAYGFIKTHGIDYVYARLRRERLTAEAHGVKELLEQGLTVTAISERTGIGRSRLQRRLRRLGIAANLETYELLKRINVKRRHNKDKPKFDPWPLPHIDRTDEPESLRVATEDLERHHCRYVHGNPSDGDWHYCGHQVVPEKVYCDFHYKICYVSPDETSGDVL